MLWWWWCRSRCFLLPRAILTLAKLISRSLLRKVAVIHMFPVRLHFHFFRDASYDYDTTFQYVPFKAITFGWLWVVMLADQWLVCTVSSWHGILVCHMCGLRGPQILTSWRRRWRHLLQSCRTRYGWTSRGAYRATRRVNHRSRLIMPGALHDTEPYMPRPSIGAVSTHLGWSPACLIHHDWQRKGKHRNIEVPLSGWLVDVSGQQWYRSHDRWAMQLSGNGGTAGPNGDEGRGPSCHAGKPQSIPSLVAQGDLGTQSW